MGSFERFKTKTHFNSLKRLVGVTALAVKLLTVALATAAGGGTPLDLLARVPASLADLGAALLVFEVLRTRRPLQLAARSAILVAVSPVLFVASGLHGDRIGVAVALLLLAMYLLVALFAAWVPTLAWDWDSLAAAPSGGAGPGGLGPGWVLARSVDQGLAGWLAGPGRPLVLAAAVLPAVVWVRRRPRRAYAAVGLVLLAPLALAPAWSPRDLVWPAVFGYLGDARWASIYAVAAGATLLWTSTWWGTGVPWHGGVDPATVPSGAVAGLSLVTWVVLGSWLVLGWRTVTVEAGAADALAHLHPDAGSASRARGRAPSRRSVSVPNQYQGPRMPGPPRRTVLKVLKPGMELLLFRLGDRGYTSPRERVREVVATRTGRSASWSARWSGCCATTPRPACPKPPRPSGYVRASFQTLGASWLLIDWNAIRLPTGITAPR
jgi:hypothetical protein